jgi:hypothetical protein
VLFQVGVLCAADGGNVVLNAFFRSELFGALIPVFIVGFFAFVLGIAFGRFLLRVMPPPLFGWAKRGQIAVISVSFAVALIGFFILATLMSARVAIDDAKQTTDHPGAMTTSEAAVGLALAGSWLCTILWTTGAVGPLLVRHRRPRAFLESPFVLFLRRFSTFSDRTIVALVLRQAKAGVPVVFLTPTHSRPKDWDPFVVGFAGLKLQHPLRSVPMVLRARDDDWQRAAEELISRAQTIVVDISEGSAALQTETEMIESAGRWQDTVCLRRILPGAKSIQDSPGVFSNAHGIDYSKSWTRALPRLAISLPIVIMGASLIMETINGVARFQSSWITALVYLFSLVLALALVIPFFSIFWRPAVSRNAKIELRKVLRPEDKSENKRANSNQVRC